jgi:hypothetical protein
LQISLPRRGCYYANISLNNSGGRQYVFPSSGTSEIEKYSEKAPAIYTFLLSGSFLSYPINYDDKLAYFVDDIRVSDVMSCIKKISE